MPNSPGIIDSDYQGEIKVPLMAVHQPVKLELGQRFAQLVIVPRPLVELELVREFSAPTDRGEGGFGSTGVSSGPRSFAHLDGVRGTRP